MGLGVVRSLAPFCTISRKTRMFSSLVKVTIGGTVLLLYVLNIQTSMPNRIRNDKCRQNKENDTWAEPQQSNPFWARAASCNIQIRENQGCVRMSARVFHCFSQCHRWGRDSAARFSFAIGSKGPVMADVFVAFEWRLESFERNF
jgi:hypothetical protein